jgi:N-acyl-L-homoserine lactone synthetase
MIHVVSGANQHLYARQLDQMFRLRMSSGSAVRVDPQDEADDVVYLLRLDHWGEVIASVRLNPGDGGAWRLSLWPDEAQHWRSDGGGLPQNPHHELMVGVLEFCLARRARQLVLDVGEQAVARLAAHGWPRASFNMIDISTDLLAVTRQTTGVSQPTLIQLDPELPAA